MLNSTEAAIEVALNILNGSIINLKGKRYKVQLEEYFEKPTLNLSDILLYKPEQGAILKRINSYKNFENSTNKYRIPAFYFGANYIFRNSDDIDKKDKAQDLMCQYFNVDDRKEFTSIVTEFRNLKMGKTRGKQISRNTEYIYYEFNCFSDHVILKILNFCLYHPYEFNIDIDYDRIEDAFIIK